ncbi:flagellar hook-length control protein FliK [Hydrogenophaga sp. 2FB]|uniref:flagellar hook-length control protein FliK n=1 Tax=Hydrogenophaga sp. 2FB TaxID=2502187 RepID=UPI0010F7D6BD|nr:flagellar hook-length control protein FliK [Hydrogenophaga sp. 2FB]
MTSTTHASSTAPKPVENAHKPNQANGRADADKPTTTSDLFSALLALVSDTHATAATDEPQDTTKTDVDPTALDPLAAMMAWMVPAQSATDTDASARTAAKGPATADADTPRAQGVDIEGMTRVDEPATPNAAAQARAAAASRPAFSPFNPHASAATAATSARATDGQASSSGTPAMVWQRGNPGTEALQQQNATQLAQVRSTVALNKRFGLAGVPPELNAAAPSPSEFTTSRGTGSGPISGPASTTDTSTAGLVGTGAANDAGSGNGEHAADAQTHDGQPQNPAEAGREAEGPTVSHWGTQHLRHASLRVGGEGGADAIDIQLQVKGQEVQVAFQTDNAEARAHLRESAGESLADLMQRGGIQLGSVSVGSQGQAQSDTSRQPRPTGPSTEALGRTASAAQAPRPLAQPRTDGSRPLDVFA